MKKTIKCKNCNNIYSNKPKWNSLWFNKYTCPKCNHTIIIPLWNSYRIFYWFILLNLLLSIWQLLRNWKSINFDNIPGLLFIISFFAIIALIEDFRISKKFNLTYEIIK